MDWKCVKLLIEGKTLSIAFNNKDNMIRIRSYGMKPMEVIAGDCDIDEKIPDMVYEVDFFI